MLFDFKSQKVSKKDTKLYVVNIENQTLPR